MPSPRAPFRLLADPLTYVACDWNLCQDHPAREHWVAFFKRHLETILSLGLSASTAPPEGPTRAAACRAEFIATFDRFAKSPQHYGFVSIITLDNWRDEILRKHGFGDAFHDLKNRENTTALPLLPAICRELDSLSGEPQLRAVIEGVFAGNIFDMGAEATAKQFLHGGPNFHDTRANLPKRPWQIDQYDAFAQRALNAHGTRSMGPPAYQKIVFFIDNAGSDFLLGALPMMRCLAQRGARIILAANERPTLNDMTIHDVQAWWPRILATEPSLKNLPITLVSTGTGEPLIDLSAVSDDLNTASEHADLVILEGMGRGVESNLNAIFTCDALNLAMLKDHAVAQRVHGKIYDVICRFR